MRGGFGAGASEKDWQQYLAGVLCYKNLSEAAQLLLARCQAEIAQLSSREEPEKHVQSKRVISIEEWRPPEPVRAGESAIGSARWAI